MKLDAEQIEGLLIDLYDVPYTFRPTLNSSTIQIWTRRRNRCIFKSVLRSFLPHNCTFCAHLFWQ